MIHGVGLLKEFWGEAALTFNYTHNRTITKGRKDGKTPYEAWTGFKPKVSHLRAFRSPVFVHINIEKRRKLDPKSFCGIFGGYSLNRSGYRIWDGKNSRIIDSRNIKFLEEEITTKSVDYRRILEITKNQITRLGGRRKWRDVDDGALNEEIVWLNVEGRKIQSSTTLQEEETSLKNTNEDVVPTIENIEDPLLR